MNKRQQLIASINDEKNILIGVGLLNSRIDFYKKELKRKTELYNRILSYSQARPKWLHDRIQEIKLTIEILSK